MLSVHHLTDSIHKLNAGASWEEQQRGLMASNARQRHRSFLLRLWRAGNGNAPQWRMLLEDTRTHERHGFVDLASLLAFLEEQIGDDVQPRPITEPGGTAQE